MDTDTPHDGTEPTTCDHCDGEGTEVVMGPTGYIDGPCSHCPTDGPAPDPLPGHWPTPKFHDGDTGDPIPFPACPACGSDDIDGPHRGHRLPSCRDCGMAFDEPANGTWFAISWQTTAGDGTRTGWEGSSPGWFANFTEARDYMAEDTEDHDRTHDELEEWRQRAEPGAVLHVRGLYGEEREPIHYIVRAFDPRDFDPEHGDPCAVCGNLSPDYCPGHGSDL